MGNLAHFHYYCEWPKLNKSCVAIWSHCRLHSLYLLTLSLTNFNLCPFLSYASIFFCSVLSPPLYHFQALIQNISPRYLSKSYSTSIFSNYNFQPLLSLSLSLCHFYNNPFYFYLHPPPPTADSLSTNFAFATSNVFSLTVRVYNCLSNFLPRHCLSLSLSLSPSLSLSLSLILPIRVHINEPIIVALNGQLIVCICFSSSSMFSLFSSSSA